MRPWSGEEEKRGQRQREIVTETQTQKEGARDKGTNATSFLSQMQGDFHPTFSSYFDFHSQTASKSLRGLRPLSGPEVELSFQDISSLLVMLMLLVHSLRPTGLQDQHGMTSPKRHRLILREDYLRKGAACKEL